MYKYNRWEAMRVMGNDDYKESDRGRYSSLLFSY